jgi:hypothetical protein
MDQDGLERQVARAADLAIRLDRLDVADHLIEALRTLCSEAFLGSPLADAYLAIGYRAKPEDMSCRRHTTAAGIEHAGSGTATAEYSDTRSLYRRARRTRGWYRA